MQISVLEEIFKHMQALGPAVGQIKRVFLLLNPLSLLRWLESVVELKYSTAELDCLSAEVNCVTDTLIVPCHMA